MTNRPIEPSSPRAEPLRARARAAQLLAERLRAADELELESLCAEHPELADDLRELYARRGRSRYRIERELAHGGMGTILEAWDEDLRRRVAMKVVRADGEGPSLEAALRARFVEEAQVTGQLDHPGVVPVHALGAGDDGAPYFTMKLVREGRTLDDVFALVAADADGWTRARALGALMRVCEAMAYAHDKGVLHRDLKPANVMVGRFGEVYVMDWGLAKVRGGDGARDVRVAPPAPPASTRVATDRRRATESDPDSPLVTLDGTVLGTPAYMPPEQAAGEHGELGPWSDVYSAGAVLYHLLAGRAPYAPESGRVSPGAVLSMLVAGPPAPIATLAPEAPAELVAICERAMARDPRARYPDMVAMAEDLRAFLEGRVVRAYRTGALVELSKWVARNRGMAASIAAAVALALGGLGATSVVQARASERVAREAAIAEAVNAFLNEDLLAAVAPSTERGRGRDVSMREVLDVAAERIDAASRPGGRFADEPLVEAAIRTTLGATYLELGEADAAAAHLERAYELRARERGDDDPSTLDALANLAVLYARSGRTGEAEELQLEAVERSARTLGADDRGTLASRANLAGLYATQGRSEEAADLFRDVLERSRRALGADDRGTLAALNGLAALHASGGRHEQAEALYAQALATSERALGDEHPDVLALRHNLADVYYAQGRLADAERLYADVLEARQRVLGPEHPRTLASVQNLALVVAAQGRVEEAERLHVEALEAQRRVLGDSHRDTLHSRTNLAVLYERQGRVEEAERLYRAVLDESRRVLGDEDPATLAARENLAILLALSGRGEEAEPLHVEVAAARERVFGRAHPKTIASKRNLALLYEDEGRFDEAVALYEEALEATRDARGDEDAQTRRAMRWLAAAHAERGDFDAAEALFADELEATRRALGDDDAETIAATDSLAWFLLDRRPSAAERALPLAQRANEATRFGEPLYLETLSRARHATGDTARAIELAERALELAPADDAPLRADLEAALAEYERALAAEEG